MLRISAREQYGRETSSSQDTSIMARGFACRPGQAIARDASHGQDRSNSRETGQLSVVSLIFHYASFVPERYTPETGRTH